MSSLTVLAIQVPLENRGILVITVSEILGIKNLILKLKGCLHLFSKPTFFIMTHFPRRPLWFKYVCSLSEGVASSNFILSLKTAASVLDQKTLEANLLFLTILAHLVRHSINLQKFYCPYSFGIIATTTLSILFSQSIMKEL